MNVIRTEIKDRNQNICAVHLSQLQGYVLLLQILESSHKLGRVDHITIGDKVGADPQRVEAILAHASLPHLYVEVEPGDAIFFHCNVLHTSAQNKSDARRWAYLMCYNTASNSPIKPQSHSIYTPLEKVKTVCLWSSKALINGRIKISTICI